MTSTNRTARMFMLAAGTALASLSVSGCATKSAPRADLSANRAEVALKQGKVSAAIANAEAAVLAEPRNAAYRSMLGAAYLEAGRFLSARTSFDDAMTLGDESARTALGFALAAIGSGDRTAALEVLEDWRDDIPAADLGLAYALAGDAGQGVQILTGAVRGGDNTPKARQNLAYALALGGNWAGARIIAMQDVPADQIDARIQQWAATAAPEQSQVRVAALLGTQAVADGGQPAQLALANNPSNEQLAAEAAATAVTPSYESEAAAVAIASAVPAGELPPVTNMPAAPIAEQTAVAIAAREDFQAAFTAPAAVPVAATPAQMIAAAAEFVSQPIVQQASTRLAAADAAPVEAKRRAAPRQVAPAAEGGDHLVQLGSFSTEASARRAWTVYARQYPQLSRFDMVITKAVVRGKTYFRVSAGGMQRAQAAGMCSAVRGRGQGCFAWTEGRPMQGAVQNSAVRMAAR